MAAKSTSDFLEAAEAGGLISAEMRLRDVLHSAGRPPLPLSAAALKDVQAAWSAANLRRAFWRMPLLTLGVITRIHWQAFKLWLKGVPFFGTRPPAPVQPFQESMK